MASGPITSWQIDGETVTEFIFMGSKSLQMVTTAIKLKDTPWKKSYDQPRKVKVKVVQSCLTLCDPKDYTVHGILQARILEEVGFPFSRESFQPRDRTRVSQIAGGFFTS